MWSLFSCSFWSMRNRSVTSDSRVCHASSFSNQPPRVLIVDTSPPWWSETRSVLCEALENFFTLASSLEGPSRVPLLSLYAVNLQQECLLPFVVREIIVCFECNMSWFDCVKFYNSQSWLILCKPTGNVMMWRDFYQVHLTLAINFLLFSKERHIIIDMIKLSVRAT